MKSFCKSLPVILGLLSLLSCVRNETTEPCFQNSHLCRPFHAGVLKLDPELDAIKPLAPIDTAGWVLTSDVLVGAVRDHWVAGVSLKNRKILWWLKVDDSVATPIAAFGSWVILGLRDGSVLKVETLTGKKVWEAKLGRFVVWPFTMSGSVLLGVTTSQQLFSLDFQTGNTNWVYDAGDPASSGSLIIRSGAQPFVRGSEVLLGTSGGELHVINLEDGSLLWKFNPAVTDFRFHDVVGEIVAENNRIVMTRYDGIAAMIVTDGLDRKVVWKEELGGITTSTSRGGVVYIGTLNGQVHAIEVVSGKKLWQTEVGQPISSITVGEKALYAAGTDGRIAAIEKNEGKALWFDDIAGSLTGKPIIFGDKIYFATGLRVLYGFKLL